MTGFCKLAARRLACLAMTVLLAAFLAVVLVRLAPGFGMDERALDPRLSAASARSIEESYGGNQSLFRYFAGYLAALASADLGRSHSLGQPVRELLRERFPVTVRSTLEGLLWAWLAAAAAVLALGLRRVRSLDAAAMSITGGLLCLPAAIVGLFAFYLGKGPPLALGVILVPRIFRYLRSVTNAVARRPHVLAARARGVAGLRLVARHIWLPAVGELAALAAISVNMALGAAIPVEALCDSPGVGQLAWKAALARDLPVLVTITILIAAVTAAANLAADLARSVVLREA